MSNDKYNGFIYETINTITGKRYIGRHGRSGDPNDPDDSWYLGSGVAINDAIEKYGRDAFIREMLDEGPLTLDEAIAKEEYYLSLYDCAHNEMYYNLTNTSHEGYPVLRGIAHPGYGKPSPMKGRHHSEESRIKISESLQGRVRTVETRKLISESLRGRKLSDSTREKLRESLKGNKNSLGLKHSKEHNEKISRALSGTNNPMYGRRSAFCGRHHSVETIEKIREANIGREVSKEVKEKMRDMMKGRIFVNNGIMNKMIDKSLLEEYIALGYVLGRLSR